MGRNLRGTMNQTTRMEIMNARIKEPPPQGGALPPKFSKRKIEIPKSLDPESSLGPGSG